MNPDNALLQMLLSTWFWLVMLTLWIVWWWNSRKWPTIYAAGTKNAPPGTLLRGGSDKTSGTEKRVLSSLTAAGYRTLPSELYLVVPLTDKHGNWRKFTPDILLAKPKVVVEVDPYRWHGEAGPHKIYEDVERNIAYSACGWSIVRVRIGWPEDHPWRKIGKYDVVIESDDFYPVEHAAAVAKAVAKAKPVKARSWNRQLAALQPFKDQHDAAKDFEREQRKQWGG